MYRKEVINLLAAAESDYRAAEGAVRYLLARAQSDPTILHALGIELADVRRCRADLERTYLVRLFSVFEEYLRDVWRGPFAKRTHPKAEDLLQGCAARQSVPDDYLTRAHDVRKYRNSIVHGGDASVVMLTTAREYLCTFFSRMPPEW